jgi:hypothetical protein
MSSLALSYNIRQISGEIFPFDVTAIAGLTCKRQRATAMNEYLIASIETAHRTIQRFAEAGFEPAQAIERQLNWCWKRANGEIDGPPPAALCMSYIMSQEFEKYGAYPMLAHHLRAIEAMIELLEMNADDVAKYAALSA